MNDPMNKLISKLKGLAVVVILCTLLLIFGC